jgi:hypothetical protein
MRHGRKLMNRQIKSILPVLLLLFVVSIAHSQGDPTVYITKTGSKYHRAGCSYLKKSTIAVKLSEASVSYSPCSRCNPPAPGSSERVSQESQENATGVLKGSQVESQQSSVRSGETAVGTTPTGKTIYVGPRGGLYHYSKSGKKVYERRR